MNERIDYLVFLLSTGVSLVETLVREGTLQPTNDVEYWLRLTKTEIAKYDQAKAN